MAERIYNVLFLCTGNSARGIMAEVLLNRLPTGQVHPLAIEQLERARLPTEGLRSKDWNEFARPGVQPLDFAFTICDKAASEVCPVWPGQPMTAHRGVEHPAAVEADETQRRRAFALAFSVLQRRISLFLSLPITKLDAMALQLSLIHI